jgi:hypothetical protein
MALTQDQQDVWNQLSTLPKQSLDIPILHTPEDISMEAPGIYAVWEGDVAIYIGVATLSRPEGATRNRLWGLKGRLESHRRGQLSGSSLAVGIWFCRIAPTLSVEDHRKISARLLNPSSLTEQFIKKLTYTCIVIDNAGIVEAAIYREKMTEINVYQEFLRLDNWKRSKAQLASQVG